LQKSYEKDCENEELNRQK